MQDVTIAQLTTDTRTAYGIGPEDAEALVRYAITAVGATLPAGAYAVTEGVATDAYDYIIAGDIDPAAAVEMVMDRVDPEDHTDLSPAALRDYCRRAAYDLYGIVRQKVTADKLPAIADEVARRLSAEAEPARRISNPDAGVVIWQADASERFGFQLIAKDPNYRTPRSATAMFSREELATIRDRITAVLDAGE